MSAEVGSGQVAIFPTFKGFRSATTREVDGATKAAAGLFSSGFRKVGTDAGKSFGSGFTSASSASLKSATADVARAAREVSAARLKEQDATGKVRVAEAQLADARKRYSADASQVVAAEERLASAQRGHVTTQSNLIGSTEKLAAAQRSLAGATTESGRTFSKVGSGAGNAFKSQFLGVLGGVVGGNLLTGIGFTIGSKINQGIQSGIAYGLQSVDLASNLQQSTGAVESVFKDQAETIIGFSKGAATAVGLSQAKYQTFATVVGAQLKNLKVPLDQVGGKTNDLITLGADLSAQFGGSTSDAVSALSSLLRGERDPVERYGVSLKQVDIDARKAQLGLEGLTGEADKQAEIQATLSLLWEQTADSQGRFYAESDTYAHKQQVLNAKLEEAQTNLGMALLPAFTSLADYATTTLVPALEDVISAVGPQLTTALASPEFKELGDEIAPVVADLVTLGIDALPDVVGGLKDLVAIAPEVLALFKGIGGFVANGDLGPEFNNFSFGDFFDDVRANIDALHKDDPNWIPLAQEAGSNIGGAFADGIQSQAPRVVTEWSGLLGVPSTARDSRGGFFGVGTDLAGAAAEGIASGKLGIAVSTTDAVTPIPGVVGAVRPDMVVAGNSLSAGMAEGIYAGRSAAINAAGEMARASLQRARAELDSHSPSRKFFQLGVDSGQGMTLGIRSEIGGVQRAMSDMVSMDGLSGSSGLMSASTSASILAGRPIYVQNPFTGEYLLAQVDGRAQGVLAAADDTYYQTTRGGRVR